MYNWRGISRAEIAAQCTRHCAALAVRSPLTSIFYFHHHNQLLCNSAIDVIFPILFCCKFFIAFLFVPIIYCYMTPSFLFVFVLNPVLCCPCLLPPCHLAYLCMVFDCSYCIVYSSIQPPTKCRSPQFPLCLCVLAFLHLVVASFVLSSSSSPYALFSVHW